MMPLMHGDPTRRRLPVELLLAAACAAAACGGGAPVGDRSAHEAEWVALFDGESLEGWRGFRRDEAPESWTVSDGAIHFVSADGDINTGLITSDRYDDFELIFEWKVAPGGNSGVFFRVTEEQDAIWKTGPEYQVVDNVNHPDGRRPVSAAGSNYGLHGPDTDRARPPGQWNEARLLAQGARVEHWLNGHRTAAYDLWDEAWEAAVAASPFRDHRSYGRSRSGHIALQEGGPVWYRTLRVRRVRAEGPAS